MDKKYIPEILETNRLILRPVTLDDKLEIFKWTGDPVVTKYLSYNTYKTPEEAKFWIDALYNEENHLDYGIVFKETNELIGAINLFFSEKRNAWSIGYGIRQDMWNKGIVTEAGERLIDFARQKYDIEKIVGIFAKENVGSGRVMEKLGFKYVKDCKYSKNDKSQTFEAKQYEIDFR